MTTERWLLEESRNESMILNVVDILLLQSSLTSAIAKGQLVVLIIFLIIFLFCHVLNVKKFYNSQEMFTEILFLFPFSHSVIYTKAKNFLLLFSPLFIPRFKETFFYYFFFLFFFEEENMQKGKEGSEILSKKKKENSLLY